MSMLLDNIFYSQTVVPSQSNQILTMPVHQLVSQIKVCSRSVVPVFLISLFLKLPQGWTDGADRYPGPTFLSAK